MGRMKTKWVASHGMYAVDRVEQIETSIPYRGTDGKIYNNHMIPATRITGFVGNIPIITVCVAGTNPQTLANFREVMARKIQDAGGSWMGRSHATETARADARQAYFTGQTGSPVAERIAAKNDYYADTPHPSDY